MIKLLLSFFDALPIIDKWMQQFAIAYTDYQKGKNNEEFIKALDTAKKSKDASALAKSLGDKLN